jgi:hypothetical protein
MKASYFTALQKELEKNSVKARIANDRVTFNTTEKQHVYRISEEGSDFSNLEKEAILPLDYLVKEPKKTAAAILTKLGINRRIYARECVLVKTDKTEATTFLNTFHLMNATQSAFNYGLYYKNELVALASFSKGRKMNRLSADQRSFELIRFCCKAGITVTGGLTKLIRNFCEEKKAGDIMTYVDKQWSDGSAFVKAGFKKHSETGPNYFLIDRKNFERKPVRDEESFNQDRFYKTQNLGNIKLVYTPGKV